MRRVLVLGAFATLILAGACEDTPTEPANSFSFRFGRCAEW